MIKLLQLLNEASFTATPRELITTCVNVQTRVSFSSPKAEYYTACHCPEKNSSYCPVIESNRSVLNGQEGLNPDSGP